MTQNFELTEKKPEHNRLPVFCFSFALFSGFSVAGTSEDFVPKKTQTEI